MADDANLRLAAERTFLAWIRTGLSLMGFGFVVARFGLFLRELTTERDEPGTRSTGVSIWVGTTLVLLGVAVNLFSAWRHQQNLRRLARGELLPVQEWPVGLAVALVLGVLGVVMVLNLVVLNH
jgi:putative membrane protein